MRLDAARRQALALAEAIEAPYHQGTSFRVGGRIFATAPPDGLALHVFVAGEQRDRALALHPHCIEPLTWGGKAAGVRIALARATPAMVRELLIQAWRRQAPKRLAASADRH